MSDSKTAMSDMAPIHIEGLSARYGRKRVLDGLTLDVPAGSVTALCGGNGAGKTTLMRALTGELKPRRGRALVLGMQPHRKPTRVRRAVGIVADRTELPKWMRVRDHLRFLAPFYPTWSDAEAQRLLELFELDADQKYKDMSKGQRMLENLVAALAHEPEVLLLDEPFSGLDVVARRRVFEGVLGHLAERGGCALLASHSVADVARCADRVAVLKDGHIAFEDDLEAALARTERIHVRLSDTCEEWAPPGSPFVREIPGGFELTYIDGSPLDVLGNDPDVVSFERLPRDLEDVLLATSEGDLYEGPDEARAAA